MKPVVIIEADSYHLNHFGQTVEISDLESWFENAPELQVIHQGYHRMRLIDSGQQRA